ncbi:hypothetical protein BB558_000759 [Smittium angustum]|uniref:AAA+ ATPase domain-containing protein n=1 Tax=Smittium angustum TaxID=133377 RepID=A0A2U1JDJ0_SMIAN|nr:hypothetical protein BB558_000759 [Smittium angustum]
METDIFGVSAKRLINVVKSVKSIEPMHYGLQRYGVLLSGDPGTGKKLLVYLMAKIFNFKSKINDIVNEAAKNDNIIVLIRNLELFKETSIVSCFKLCIESMEKAKRSSLLISTTCNIDSVGLDLLAIFEEHIPLLHPNSSQRESIFKYFLRDYDIPETGVEYISDQCFGFSIADISSIVSKGLINSIKDQNPFSMQHILEAKKKVVPTFSEALFVKTSGSDQVKWSNIGGLLEAKKKLEEAIIWPHKYKRVFKRLLVKPPRGILLYGPPGTGKTLLARAVATESDSNFMVLSSTDLVKAEVGRSEKAISNIFKTARKTSPTIIFIDELESIFSRHEDSGNLVKKMVSQILVEIDDLSEGDDMVTVLAATNAIEMVSLDLLQPGRIDLQIFIGPPSFDERVDILEKITSSISLKDVNFNEIAKITEGFTGAELSSLVKIASNNAFEKTLKKGDHCGNVGSISESKESDTIEGIDKIVDTRVKLVENEDIGVSRNNIKVDNIGNFEISQEDLFYGANRIVNNVH